MNNINYIDPNHLMQTKGITFIFGGIENKLYTADSHIAHKQILEDDKIWFKLVGYQNEKLNQIEGSSFKRRAMAENLCLLGRTGLIENSKVVSFWGEDVVVFNKYMKSCLNKLLENRSVEQHSLLYTLIYEVATVADFLADKTNKQQTNDKQYEINGEIYSWSQLREIRTRTHTQNNEKDVNFLCNLLTKEVIKKYPELQSLIPTKCFQNYISKDSNFQKYMRQGLYPVVGDCVNFKKFLTISETNS